MKLQRPTHRPAPESTIALINVVFLLLIFFMLAGQLRQSPPFEVAPPRSDSEDAADNSPATLAVGTDGQLALGGARVTLETLTKALGERDGGIPERLRLKADSQVPATRVIALMSELRAAGVKRISLLTVRDN
ncbi:ExbD/TolR family protein [Rhodovibrio salinarum]|uniref:Biopolymer transporter ExbD n=1 Tax=Rhodovibrio salinarum TaxID=1087 RepID=A0A934QJ08_9PROT|nr:biopolymer transporter ExbD [Rhodovibrio salinarum]MBK1697774.1 biopolymer transporter ExbD [Rhodovibrio salinarum]